MAPANTFSSAAQGHEAAVSGDDRMMDRPADGALTPTALLAAHRERSLCGICGAKTVLLIQDGSDLNVATPGACAGLGVISRTKGSAGTLEIPMHSPFAVKEDGVP